MTLAALPTVSAGACAAPALPFHEATVLAVHHWTDTLFSFRTTRDPGFRFESGQFVMIGLMIDRRPLLRAYSLASPSWAEELEFYSIKVQGGAFTQRLREIVPGDSLLVGKKPTGTLVLNGLLPGKRLYLLSTGTGLAPFLGLVREPETYERFGRAILTHGCREAAELSYRELLEDELPNHEFLGELARERLVYYPHVTRERHANQGRITDLIASGKLARDLGLPALDPAHDRVMICGGAPTLADLKAMLIARGFTEGSVSSPGDFVIERAFVDK